MGCVPLVGAANDAWLVMTNLHIKKKHICRQCCSMQGEALLQGHLTAIQAGIVTAAQNSPDLEGFIWKRVSRVPIAFAINNIPGLHPPTRHYTVHGGALKRERHTLSKLPKNRKRMFHRRLKRGSCKHIFMSTCYATLTS